MKKKDEIKIIHLNWGKKTSNFFSIYNYKKPWKENDIKPDLFTINAHGWFNPCANHISFTIEIMYIMIEYCMYDYKRSSIRKVFLFLSSIKSKILSLLK